MNDTKTLIQSSIVSLIIVVMGLFMLCVGGTPRINVDTPLIEADGFDSGSGEMSDDDFLSMLETADDNPSMDGSTAQASSNDEDDLFASLLADDDDASASTEEGDDDLAELLALLEADDSGSSSGADNSSSNDESLFNDLLTADESSSTPDSDASDASASDDDVDELEALLYQMDEAEGTASSSQTTSTNSDQYASIELEIQRLESVLNKKNSKIDSIQSEIYKFDEQIAQMETDGNRPKGTPPASKIQYASYEQQNNTNTQAIEQRESSSISSNFSEAGSSPEAYDLALNYYYDRQYRMAVAAFESVLNENPKGSLADNCQYWIGEAYYGQGKYLQAIAEFEKVFAFDSADKRDDAQIMMGLAYMKLGEANQARNDFVWLVACYGGSEYSNKARQYMNQL
ncbi:tetratricopeptide repeat protein [candidate division KSB1 bacterium]|nr:tetratricopeptide repeat protein [candidate division KSB1 bacterium]